MKQEIKVKDEVYWLNYEDWQALKNHHKRLEYKLWATRGGQIELSKEDEEFINNKFKLYV